MSESDFRFAEGRKRKREAETPPVRKRPRSEPDLTPEEMDQIALLIAATVQRYTEAVTEDAEAGVQGLSQEEFEYHLYLDQGDPGEEGPPQTPELHETGDDFYPTTGFMSGSPLDDDDVVMDSYPEEIAASPREGETEEDHRVHSPFETAEDLHAWALAAETGEELDDEFDEVYVDQAIEEIAGEVLSEILDEVINEISHDVGGDVPLDAEVLRWLIQRDPDIAGSLGTAREQTMNMLREKISELSRDPSMVER
jgi:hypothetical protein